MLLAAGLALGLGAGCSSNSSSNNCAGIVIDGQCQKQCTDNACAPGTRCVVFGDLNNACESPCKSHSDCRAGTDCETYRFPTGTQANYCVHLDYSRGGRTGQHEACQTSNECDTPRGYSCIGQTCRHPCKQNSDCPSSYLCGTTTKKDDKGKVTRYCVANGTGKQGGTCKTSTDCDQLSGLECIGQKCGLRCRSSDDCAGGHCAPGGNDTSGKPTDVCVPDSANHGKGQYGTYCPKGASDCDSANGFVCAGTGIVDDPDAYCTQRDCKANSDCATGYFCSLQRTATVPCQDACGLKGDSKQKSCAQAANIGAGKRFQCGPLTLLRHICLKRQFCNECQTDADCLAKPNQVCAKDKGGHKICTVFCDPNTNSCPWGSAAICGIFDKALGKPTCAHRFGSCKGTGASCDPCVDDNDCGSNGLCTRSSFTGEHYCVNLSDSCSCPSGTSSTCDGGGCPKSPGGLTMTCYGGSQVQSGGSPLYDKCVGADTNVNPLATPQMGCWPAH